MSECIHAVTVSYVGLHKKSQKLPDLFTSFKSKTHNMNLIDMQNVLEQMKLTFSFKILMFEAFSSYMYIT